VARTWNEKTGWAWVFHVPFDEQEAYFRAHPPSALHTLRCSPIELPGYPFDGHGEPVNAVFAITCPCGSRQFTAARWVNEQDELGPPISIACGACGASHVIYDDTKDGFDALAGSASPTESRLGNFDAFTSVPPPYEVVMRFEFPSDLLGSGEFPGREPEAFSWVTVLVKPNDGGPYVLLFDDECA
jgi:hypothetical protein